MNDYWQWRIFVGFVATCLIGLITVTALLFTGVIPTKSKSVSVKETARICVFSKTEVWCIYPKEYNND